MQDRLYGRLQEPEVLTVNINMNGIVFTFVLHRQLRVLEHRL